MTTTIELNPTLTLDLSAVKFTSAQFQELCQTNRDLRLERLSSENRIKCSCRYILSSCWLWTFT